ncbi:MAG: DUF1624 domain-containing protein [Butyricicoccus sp.]|nr:DUF1624 domain-containing protein [Butyricicoccus sp.]
MRGDVLRQFGAAEEEAESAIRQKNRGCPKNEQPRHFIIGIGQEDYSMRENTVRYRFVDGIRGAAIINMVIFHFLYDVFIVYGKSPAWYGLPAIHTWQQMICWTFIFVSGFVWTWAKEKNFRRGVMFNLFGFLISFITLLFTPSQRILFGILNFMGCAILLILPLEKQLRKIPAALGMAICFSLFLLCKQIQFGRIGLPGLPQIHVPGLFYSIKILTPFGFPYEGFYSSDYFPIFPWIFLYLCGFYFNRIFVKHIPWQKCAQRKLPCLSVLGSKTIWIYLLHQPLCMLICLLIFH